MLAEWHRTQLEGAPSARPPPTTMFGNHNKQQSNDYSPPNKTRSQGPKLVISE